MDSAKWGLAHDLMTGVADGRYAPKADTTRAELATILDRWQTMLDRYVTVSVEHSSGSGN